MLPFTPTHQQATAKAASAPSTPAAPAPALAAASAQGASGFGMDTAAANVAVPPSVPAAAPVSGQWSDWTVCTQACGGLQKRVCSTGTGCDGPSMQFCNLLAQCPRMCTIPAGKESTRAPIVWLFCCLELSPQHERARLHGSLAPTSLSLL